jgi:hypothetical protein
MPANMATSDQAKEPPALPTAGDRCFHNVCHRASRFVNSEATEALHPLYWLRRVIPNLSKADSLGIPKSPAT